eukprot:jgi/Mesen1/934/ME000118S00115
MDHRSLMLVVFILQAYALVELTQGVRTGPGSGAPVPPGPKSDAEDDSRPLVPGGRGGNAPPFPAGGVGRPDQGSRPLSLGGRGGNAPPFPIGGAGRPDQGSRPSTPGGERGGNAPPMLSGGAGRPGRLQGPGGRAGNPPPSLTWGAAAGGNNAPPPMPTGEQGIGGRPGGPGGGPGRGGASGAVCGILKSSRKVKIYSKGTLRHVESNGCPGYNWTDQRTSDSAREQNHTFTFPLAPVMNSGAGALVGVSSPVRGPIGVFLNGVSIYSIVDALGRNALTYEGSTFDHCGGHPSPNGDYHYHVVAGDHHPASHSATRNNKFTLCPSSSSQAAPAATPADVQQYDYTSLAKLALSKP